MEISARCDGETSPEQKEATLQASSYMQPRDHNRSAGFAYLFNEIPLLDHVPQTNRLDHDLYTKHSPCHFGGQCRHTSWT